MTKADLHQLVESLPDEAVDGAALLLQRFLLHQVEPEQAWFWTERWQDQLRASLADVAAGRTRRFDSDDEFLASFQTSAVPTYETTERFRRELDRLND